MIKKKLHFIFCECIGDDVQDLTFNSFNEFHKYIFENGLPDDFQLDDPQGNTLLRYRNEGTFSKLHYDHDVPGSIIFEISNQEQRLK